MARRVPETLADYLVIAISPALIMLLVGSLMFFLVEVFYQGQYQLRLLWVMAMFVMAIVCIARISMEEGNGYAAIYALPLAVVVGLALVTFVQVQGPLASISPLINWGLMALVWWSSHKLTWDCTLIDDSQDASGAGLLQQMGWSDEGNGADNAAPAPPAADAEATTAVGATPDPRWWLQMFERDRRPHTPGVWVVYFSLAALPLYGIGGWFIPSDDLDLRRRTFWLMVVYVASGLALLLSTSFLGLRKYLRLRRLEMPAEMAATWVGLGVALIVGTLVVAALLPRPSSEYSIAHVLVFDSPDREASDYGFGPEGAEKSSDDGGQSAESQEGQQAQNEGGGQGEPKSGSQGENNSEGAGDDGSSGSDGNSGKGKAKGGKSGGKGDGKSANGDGENGDAENSDSQNGDSEGGKSPKGKKNKGGKGKKGETAEGADEGSKGKQDSDEQESSQAQDKSRESNSGSSSSSDNDEANQSSNSSATQSATRFLSQVSGWAGTLVKGLFYVALIIVGAFLAWKYREQLAAAWKKLLDELRELWAKWFGAKTVTDAAVAEAIMAARPRPFSDFADPFASGMAARWPLQQLVTYSFTALEAWGREHGCPREAGQTPHEFAAALGERHASLAREARHLADLYSHIAYAPKSIASANIEPLRLLWQKMVAAQPVFAGT